MNRSRLPWLSIPFVCVTGLMIACGPRMKPVEYEEPKDLSSGSEFDDSSSGNSSSSSSDSSSSSSSSSSSNEESTSNAKWGGACKDKKCGETCSECPPGDDSCMEVLVLRQCNPKGECVPARVECSAVSDKSKDKNKDKSKK